MLSLSSICQAPVAYMDRMANEKQKPTTEQKRK